MEKEDKEFGPQTPRMPNLSFLFCDNDLAPIAIPTKGRSLVDEIIRRHEESGLNDANEFVRMTCPVNEDEQREFLQRLVHDLVEEQIAKKKKRERRCLAFCCLSLEVCGRKCQQHWLGCCGIKTGNGRAAEEGIGETAHGANLI